LKVELLEDRTLLSATLVLDGPQTLVPNPNVAASSDPATRESEMSLAINPTNPLNVVGFTHDVQQLSHIQVFYSMDGGLTWNRTLISGSGDVNNDGQGSGAFDVRFDPTVVFDANGNLFIGYGAYSGASNITNLTIGQSTDGGASFANDSFRVVDGQFGYGGVDKFYLAVGAGDPSGATQALYVSWERNSGSGQPIMVAGSNDGGNTFTTPTVIDTFGGGSFWATPSVGPNGELYVVWMSATDQEIKSRVKPDGLWGGGDWNPTVVVQNLHGHLTQFSVPPQSRRGIYFAPSIDVGKSGGPFTGRAYVTWIDQVSGVNTDVYLSYSDDLGATWSPVGPTGNVEDAPVSAFHTTVSVDQSSGSVTVLYRTNDGYTTDNHTSTVKVATSIDGGNTFSKAELADARSRALSCDNGNEFGDYSGLNVFDGTIQGFWSDNRGPTDGTYTAKLYAYSGSAAFQSSTGTNTLYVVGDTIDYGPSPVNPAYLQVIVDGQLQYAGLALSVDNIVVNPPAGARGPVTVHGYYPGIALHVNASIEPRELSGAASSKPAVWALVPGAMLSSMRQPGFSAILASAESVVQETIGATAPALPQSDADRWDLFFADPLLDHIDQDPLVL
jgi:hypothetical protein